LPTFSSCYGWLFGHYFGLFVQSIILCNANLLEYLLWRLLDENQEPFPGSVLQVAYLEAGKRPDFLNTKDTQKQPKISRQWRKSEKKKGKQ